MPRIHHQNGGSNDGSTTEPLLASVSTLSSPPIKVVVKLSRPLKTPIHIKTTANQQQSKYIDQAAPIHVSCDILWYCIKCDTKNLSPRKWCSNCHSWKGGKRTKYSRSPSHAYKKRRRREVKNELNLYQKRWVIQGSYKDRQGLYHEPQKDYRWGWRAVWQWLFSGDRE